jgi:hypothetical protein
MHAHKLGLAAATLALSLGGVPASTALAHGKPAQTSHRGAQHGSRHRHQKGRTTSFMAEVVRSNANGIVLRTNDGRMLSFSARQIRAAKTHRRPRRHHARLVHAASDLSFSSGGVVINVLGLQPGTIVNVTETIADDGTITITITLPPAGASEQANGVVTDVEDDSFTLAGADGSALRMHMAPDPLSQLGLQVCQTVDVTYHDDGGILIVDSVNPTGTSADGDCAPTTDTDGVITQVSSDGLVIDTGQGTASYSVDPSSGVTDGYQQGDLVDVTSTTNADGSLQAVDVNFVEEDASGPVTAVTTSTAGGSLTVQESDSGNSVTVDADPNNGVQINAYAFNGISVGDDVSVTYHQSAGQLIADTVSEQ